MVQLVDLPDELLLIIVYCLHNIETYDAIPSPVCFVDWPQYAQIVAARQSKKNSLLLPVIRTCKIFREIATPILYDNVSLNYIHRRLTRFTCIRETKIPSQGTKIIHSAVSDARIQLVPLFALPNLLTLSIDSFNSFTALSHPESFYRKSSVTTLHLSNCGAPEDVLTGLLRYPRKLKELRLDTDQTNWHGQYTGYAPRFSASAVVRACSAQSKNLVKLTLTHSRSTCVLVNEDYRLDIGYRVNLSSFTALQHLEISYDMLVGADKDDDVYRALPVNLASLKVYKEIMWGEPPTLLHSLLERKKWLEQMAQNKPTSFPKLETFSLQAREDLPSQTWITDEDERRKFSTILQRLSYDFAEMGVVFTVKLDMPSYG